MAGLKHNPFISITKNPNILINLRKNTAKLIRIAIKILIISYLDLLQMIEPKYRKFLLKNT